MIQINKATSESDFETITRLADIIWREYYPSIISIAQIDYMLAKFNSSKAIKTQIEEGSIFYYMTYNNKPVGYTAIKLEESFLFLSKLYILKNYRGKGIGKNTLNFINNKAKKYNSRAIKLKVNKYNTASIKAYEKLGFEKTKVMITDIGNGFIMDDYELEKRI
ncbi:GNAT family N-acetyltransferase [Flavivirga aquatica]|uniref:GNAT family N-acetyltransferase n=1 Tax=Flavivirga aquatica TaxID=1849968 RepID=A0A1E5SH74_9FLAO|nr:GNAT family N-acetyltransferase [Flavivirga aquatica]OEJ98471.1 GNAT family N-acetyltransferase [Flavivirga aquatica]